MAKILIIYSSKFGQTKKIAAMIQKELISLGQDVTACHVSKTKNSSFLKNFDAIIGGAPVYAGHFPKDFQKWAASNTDTLNVMPTAFFSVCLGILEKNQKTQETEKKIVRDFFTASGWYPSNWTIFSGALLYTKYNRIIRFIMKKIASKAGGQTDTHNDYEYTNWDEVRRFAQNFSTDYLPGPRKLTSLQY